MEELNKIKKWCNGILFWFNEFGINPLKLFSGCLNFFRYLNQAFKFRLTFKGSMEFRPCLHDRKCSSGAAGSEYFWQDLLVAKKIQQLNPRKHLDIGSRVDGFIAHVASFRVIEVVDIRPSGIKIPGINFIKIDILNSSDVNGLGLSYCDSISTLHAFEHFGLGRYGDEVDQKGYEKAFQNISKLLSKGGRLYLSTPIGREKVQFNANWVFNAATIQNLAISEGMKLEVITAIRPKSVGYEIITLDDLRSISNMDYTLTLFEFIKL